MGGEEAIVLDDRVGMVGTGIVGEVSLGSCGGSS